ncbi:hypothetical protein KSF_049180 [Reticulibacter mediterranei]|uniref:Uncharacterized protein n=1 Tax=Reticulibacter mediterranei TaxID=2778369 RepID=A0A8J3N430_9CHLR|nr:hypothetical protein [Reticulibacter mediterranei]GHO94870.1 hypothetical protein KSF_049180 [Reticulibacter mediterranei]
MASTGWGGTISAANGEEALLRSPILVTPVILFPSICSLESNNICPETFLRQRYTYQAHSLLITRISLGAANGDSPRNLLSWVWAPLLHRDRLLDLREDLFFCLLTRVFHLGENAC